MHAVEITLMPFMKLRSDGKVIMVDPTSHHPLPSENVAAKFEALGFAAGRQR